MSDKKIFCTIEKKKINCTIKSPILKIKMSGIRGADSMVPGPQGPTGPQGPGGDHALLTNLDFINAGHTGFQKSLVYKPEYKCYEIE